MVEEVQAIKQVQCKDGSMASMCVIGVKDDTSAGHKLKLWGRRAVWAASNGVSSMRDHHGFLSQLENAKKSSHRCVLLQVKEGNVIFLSEAITSQWRDSKVKSQLSP